MSTTDVLSDNELMLRVRDGETARLGMLFERHHKKLFNYFLYTMGRRHLAEDMVQEVFVRMLKYGHTFRGDRGFEPWMFRIARNVRVEFFRTQKPESSADQVETLDDPAEGPLPPDSVETSEDVEILWTAMKRLPVEKREILVLARLKLLKQEQIAAILGCKVGTVKVRIHRALKELTKIYQRLTSEVRP